MHDYVTDLLHENAYENARLTDLLHENTRLTDLFYENTRLTDLLHENAYENTYENTTIIKRLKIGSKSGKDYHTTFFQPSHTQNATLRKLHDLLASRFGAC